MIDLTDVRQLLVDALAVVEELDGQDLDERDAATSQPKGSSGAGRARGEKAKKSQNLLRAADNLLLASGLVRHEYWVARGFVDPLDDTREV